MNKLRARANASNAPLQLTERDIIDEWCREFYMEGRCRSDLIRFGLFTGRCLCMGLEGWSICRNQRQQYI